MNNYLSNITGGVPFYWDDITYMQNAYKDGFNGVISGVGLDKTASGSLSQDTIILSGCDTVETDTGSGSVINVSEGYISINGEICKVETHEAHVDVLGAKWDIVETYVSQSKSTAEGNIIYPYQVRNGEVIQRGIGEEFYSDVKHYTDVLKQKASLATRQKQDPLRYDAIQLEDYPAYPRKRITLQEDEHVVRLTNYSGSASILTDKQCQIVNIVPPDYVYDGYELILIVEPEFSVQGIGIYTIGNQRVLPVYNNIVVDHNYAFYSDGINEGFINVANYAGISYSISGYEYGDRMIKLYWDAFRSHWIMCGFSKILAS